MVNKRNKYTKSQNNRNNDPAPVVDEEGLTTECLELHQLLKNRTAKLRELKQTDLCYLISTKWLQDWKQYVGYEQLVGDEEEKSSKKDKKFGKRHPGKINSDILASGTQARQMYTIPKQLQNYQYLNEITNQKKEKDSDYIAITEQIWITFLKYYEGQRVRRPVRPMKGSTYYDGEPLRCDVILANLQDQQLEQRIKKTHKKNYNSVFQSNKFMLSTTWTIKQLYDFLSQYCGIMFGISKIRIWKGFSYLATHPIVQSLVQSIKERKFLIKGRQLTHQRYQDKDIDDYLKISHTLIVQIGQFLKTDNSQDEQIKGYCEECVKKQTLSIACICNQVIYCSRKCRTADQTFHFKTCQVAFDSQDDQEYEKKKVFQVPLSGFQNIGNTCYMNSTIQSIVSIDIIRNFFMSNEYLKHLNEKQQKQNKCMFLRKLSKTFKILAEYIENYAPWSLKSQIDYNLPPFKGDKQHDANDFLINFLNTLNDYLGKNVDKAYHSILQPFVGQFYSNVVCPHCKGESQNNQIFLQISLPIKSKPSQKTFQYTVVESLNKVRRGKTSLSESWSEITKNINAKNAISCVSKEPMGLSLINQQQESPQKALKNIKGDAIFLLDIQKNQGEVPFVINLITFKDIAGNSMKSPYGIPSLIFVNDIIISLGFFWLQTIRKYFCDNEQYVAQSYSIQNEYLEEIQKAVKKDAIEQKQQKAETKEETQGQEQQSLRCKAIAESFQKKIEVFANKIGIKIYIVDYKRNRNVCKFCKKKCSGCELPKTIDQPFHQFFQQKYKQIRFEVYLQDYLNIDYVNQDMGITSDPNIQSCLELFTEPQQLDEENAWYCENCDSMALALKQLQVKKFPPILILHLNRFKTVDHKKIKNNDPIQYGQIQTFGGKQYRLLSVIIHEGSMDAGHYWAISLRGENYYVFNDAKVSKIDKVFHKNAYILIYQQISFKP